MSTDNGTEPQRNEPIKEAGASSLGLPLIKPAYGLHVKSVILMVLTLLIAVTAVFYALYARGIFEDKHNLILTADNSEGISIGMDLTFSGFPIGTVQQIELADDGTVRIHVQVSAKNAHRLRESSVFTLVRNVLGATKLKAYTSDWEDKPLPDNSTRAVLYGDASAEIPQLMASARTLLDNLGQLTSPQSDLAQSLAHVNELSAKLSSANVENGLLTTVLGKNTPEAKDMRAALSSINTLLAKFNQMAGRANEQVFGQQGLVNHAQSSAQELQGLLVETRQSLKKIDTILDDAKSISTNVSVATTDLDALLAEVDSSLRKVDNVMNQINNTWPFASDKKIELP